MGLLELNGLSPELLTELSYASQLGRSLKNNLDSFEKEALLQDALAARLSVQKKLSRQRRAGAAHPL